MNITPNDIQARIRSFQLDSQVEPTVSTIQQMIKESTQYVLAIVRSKGVVVGDDNSDYIRGVIIRLVTADAESIRQRDTSAYADSVRDRVDGEIARLLDRSSNLANADASLADKPAHNGRDACCAVHRPIDRWAREGKL